MEYFKIPFAGRREWSDGTLSALGMESYFWSSSVFSYSYQQYSYSSYTYVTYFVDNDPDNYWMKE